MQKISKNKRDKYLGGFIICIFLLIALVLLVGISLKEVKGATDDPFDTGSGSNPSVDSNKQIEDKGINQFVEDFLNKDKTDVTKRNEIWKQLSPENQKKVWESNSLTGTKKQDLLKSLNDENKGSLWKSFGSDVKSSILKNDFLEQLYKSGDSDGAKKVGEFFNKMNDDSALSNDKNMAGEFLLKKGLEGLKKADGSSKYTKEQIDKIKSELKGLESSDIKYFDNGVIGKTKDDGINVGNPSTWARGGEYKDGKFNEKFDSQLTDSPDKYREIVHDSGIVDSEGKFNGVNVLYGESGKITASVDKNGATSFDFSVKEGEQAAIRYNDDIIAGKNGGRAVLDKVDYADGTKKDVLRDVSNSQVWANAQYKDGKGEKWLYFKLPEAKSGEGFAVYHNSYPGAEKSSLVLIDDKKNDVLIKGDNVLFRPVGIDINEMFAAGKNIEVVSVEGTFAKINGAKVDILRQRLDQFSTSASGYTRYSSSTNADAFGISGINENIKSVLDALTTQAPEQQPVTTPPVSGITPIDSSESSPISHGTDTVIEVGKLPKAGAPNPGVRVGNPNTGNPGVRIQGLRPQTIQQGGGCPPGGCPTGGCPSGGCGGYF